MIGGLLSSSSIGGLKRQPPSGRLDGGIEWLRLWK